MKNAKIIESLYLENQDFKRSRDRHQECEKELEELQAHKYLSPEEEMQAKTLKKEKLILKDKMEKLIAQYQKN